MQLAILITVVASLLSVFGFFSELALPEIAWLNSVVGIVCLTGLPAIAYGCGRCWARTETQENQTEDQKGASPSCERLGIAIWFVASIVLCVFSNWNDWSMLALFGSDSLSGSATLKWLALLAPILTSISCVWLVNSYCLTHELGRAFTETYCRLKVYFLMTLIPLMALLLLKDLSGAFTGDLLKVVQIILMPLGILLTGLFMPHIVCWILPSFSIKETELGKRLLSLADASGTSIADVRVWGTGNRVLNAFVVGLFPFGRTVMLTDRIIKEFDHDEITSVYLHELGHAKHNHLIQRLAAAATPFFFTYAIGQLCHLPEALIIVLAILTSLIGLSMVARFLEFEADDFAVNELIHLGHNANQYVRILHRIRLENPQADRASWLHPSLSDRIRRIRLTSTIDVQRPSKRL